MVVCYTASGDTVESAPKPRFIRAPAAFVEPVPPFVTETMPVTFSAVVAEFAELALEAKPADVANCAFTELAAFVAFVSTA